MKKLIHYGGDGYGSSKEIGKYEVKYGGEEEEKLKEFTSLSQAVKFYDSLNEEKAIWDLNGCPELLDCHTFE